MKLKLYHIDAFTDSVFKGNYAAVIVLQEWLDDELMQNIATENNLSETAFAKQISDDCYHIRWFSPICEIDFCGHATLATAFVLFRQNAELDRVTFSAKAVGDLTVNRAKDDFIEMTFPNRKPEPITEIPKELLQGLDRKPQEILRNQQAYFAIYADEKDINAAKPALEFFKKLAPYDVVITAASNEYDFKSRYFWPANGGDEDPVTGSIHAGLAPYWAEKLAKNNLTAMQASERGGILQCRVFEDKVVILGKAVQYLEGTIDV